MRPALQDRIFARLPCRVNDKLLLVEVSFNPHAGAGWLFDVEQEAVVYAEHDLEDVEAWVGCRGSRGPDGESPGDAEGRRTAGNRTSTAGVGRRWGWDSWRDCE